MVGGDSATLVDLLINKLHNVAISTSSPATIKYGGEPWRQDYACTMAHPALIVCVAYVMLQTTTEISVSRDTRKHSKSPTPVIIVAGTHSISRMDSVRIAMKVLSSIPGRS